VDDFVILHNSRNALEKYKIKIDNFLAENLNIELHPNKSKIKDLDNGVSFLGFRLFFHHRLIKKGNMRKFGYKFNQLNSLYKKRIISRETVLDSLEGWLAYIEHANTYKYRRHLVRLLNHCFLIKNDFKFENKKEKNFLKKSKISNYPFSSQKTLQLFKSGLSIKEIAEIRNIKESTVLEHLAKLIEYNQLSVWKVLPKEKIIKTLTLIKNKNDRLKDIKEKLNDPSISFNDINCVLAHFKKKTCCKQTHPYFGNNAA